MNLTELREKQELSVEDMASRLGLEEAVIEAWESGEKIPKRNPKQMLDLLKLYGATLDELVEAVAKSAGGDS